MRTRISEIEQNLNKTPIYIEIVKIIKIETVRKKVSVHIFRLRGLIFGLKYEGEKLKKKEILTKESKGHLRTEIIAL